MHRPHNHSWCIFIKDASIAAAAVYTIKENILKHVSIKNCIALYKQEISWIKTEVATLKFDVGTIDDDVSNVKSALELSLSQLLW